MEQKNTQDHPAAPSSSDALRAVPLSEPSATHDHARPVQPSERYTPAPWMVTEREPATGGINIMTADRDFYVAEAIPGMPGFAEANARRIVQCVNAHDELIAALRSFVAEFGDKTNSATVNKARAALAKAGAA